MAVGGRGPRVIFRNTSHRDKKNTSSSSSSSSKDGGCPIKKPSFRCERPRTTRYTNQPQSSIQSIHQPSVIYKKNGTKKRKQRSKQRARVGLKATTLTPNVRRQAGRQAGSPVSEIVSAGTRTRKGHRGSLTGCPPTPNPSRTHPRGFQQGGQSTIAPPYRPRPSVKATPYPEGQASESRNKANNRHRMLLLILARITRAT